MVTGILPLLVAALLLVPALAVSQCISVEVAQRGIQLRVLLAIGASRVINDQSCGGCVDVSFLLFIMVIIFGASASFLTPVGYQTNLMVQGLGGYQFTDYFKVGILLSILVGITLVTTVPMVWAF